MRRFYCFDKLSPQVYLTRTTVETTPRVATRPDHFSRFSVDKAVAQGPGIGTDIERIRPIVQRFLDSFIERGQRKWIDIFTHRRRTPLRHSINTFLDTNTTIT